MKNDDNERKIGDKNLMFWAQVTGLNTIGSLIAYFILPEILMIMYFLVIGVVGWAYSGFMFFYIMLDFKWEIFYIVVTIGLLWLLSIFLFGV